MRRLLPALFLILLCPSVSWAQEGKQNSTKGKRFDATTLRKIVHEDNFQELKRLFGKPWSDIFYYVDQSGPAAHQHILECAEAALKEPAGNCDFISSFYSEEEYDRYYEFCMKLALGGLPGRERPREVMKERVFNFYCMFYLWCAKNPNGAKYVLKVSDFERGMYSWKVSSSFN